MPITVSCPSCSASFKAKDEYAGKPAKCPKCGETLTVPDASDTVKMPPPEAKTVARPVAKPRPADEENAPVSPKRHQDDDEADEKPRSKRRRDSDDEEEAPRSKRRRRDQDNKPKKKGSALPLILGIVGGLFVLCGGGCAGAWFGLVEPAAKKKREENDRLAAELKRIEEGRNTPPMVNPQPAPPLPPDTKVLVSNVAKLQAGMALHEVREILGNEVRAEEATLRTATEGLPDATVRDRWGAKLGKGHVVRWLNGQDLVLIALSGPPDLPGNVTLQGVLARFNGEPVETIRFAEGGTPPVNPAAKKEFGISGPEAPVATLTVSELTKDFDKYAGQWVVVTGKAKNAVTPRNGQKPAWGQFILEQEGERLWFNGPTGGTGDEMPSVGAGQEVEVWGRVRKISSIKEYRIDDCMLLTGAVDVDAITLFNAFVTDSAAAAAKYGGKTLRVTGKVQEVDGGRVIQAAEPKNVAATVDARFSILDRKQFDLREGDRVVVLACFVDFHKGNRAGLGSLSLGASARLVSYSR